MVSVAPVQVKAKYCESEQKPCHGFDGMAENRYSSKTQRHLVITCEHRIEGGPVGLTRLRLAHGQCADTSSTRQLTSTQN